MIENEVTDLSSILEGLKENASKVLHVKNDFRSPKVLPKITRAILFPFNKEMHSVVAFKDMLTFEVAGVYDPLVFRNIGKNTHNILGYGCSDFSIQNEAAIDWLSDFDAVILGHTRVISSSLRCDYIDKFLKMCIKFKKSIFCFDKLDEYESLVLQLTASGQWAFSPNISEFDIDNSCLGKLHGISTPVIGVFGTGTKQGKFTLQLSLRKKLQEIGYKVGGIGTEPTAQLFGLDYCYPSGYESAVSIKGGESVKALNGLMHNIDMNRNDIIVVGGQSHTVPYNRGNLGFLSLSQHEFLLGTGTRLCCSLRESF